MNKLSAAEQLRLEAIKVAIMGRRGLGLGEGEVEGHSSDFCLIMKDAEAIEDWLDLANKKAAMAAQPEQLAAIRRLMESKGMTPTLVTEGGGPAGGSTYADGTPYEQPARSVPRIPGDDRLFGESKMTAEQLEYLREHYGRDGDPRWVAWVRLFYWKTAKREGLPGLALIDDCPQPYRPDQLGVLSGFDAVRRFDADLNVWRPVDEFPGFRVENGVMHWAPGVWPPVTEDTPGGTASDGALVIEDGKPVFVGGGGGADPVPGGPTSGPGGAAA